MGSGVPVLPHKDYDGPPKLLKKDTFEKGIKNTNPKVRPSQPKIPNDSAHSETKEIQSDSQLMKEQLFSQNEIHAFTP